MLNAREGQTYICTKSNKPWWTKGKEYKVVLNSYGELCFVDDDGVKWAIRHLKYVNYQFKLKEEQPKVTMEDLKTKAVERKYTPFDVTKVILKSYQLYDNDAQRLAYIKGYFAK